MGFGEVAALILQGGAAIAFVWLVMDTRAEAREERKLYHDSLEHFAVEFKKIGEAITCQNERIQQLAAAQGATQEMFRRWIDLRLAGKAE